LPREKNVLNSTRLHREKIIKSFIDEVAEDGINLIDIGSSGSLDQKWNRVKHLINLIGFDPNKEECDRQNSLPSAYRSSVFLPYALHGVSGVATLYKTKSIYCYSLLEPNKQWLDRFEFRDLFQVEGEELIEVYSIDQIKELADVKPDVIKIDVQGLELPVLGKAGSLLNSAFYVETETGFVENYKGETLFSQLDVFMRDNGFLMFDINVNHRIPRDNLFKDQPLGNEQILWAEAVWLKDYVGLDGRGKFISSDLNPHKIKKILILCALHGCRDFGMELAEFFSSKGLLSPGVVNELASPSAWDLEESPAVVGKAELLAKLFGILPRRFRHALHRASVAALELD
jgi:FkbM family methyltransferase